MTMPPLYLLRRYLEAHGWRNEALVLRDLQLYIYNDTTLGEIEIVLPAHSEVPDANKRLEQALRSLSNLEGRSVEQVCVDVNGYGFDVIETSLPSTQFWRESITLRVAGAFVRYGYSLMLDAAASEFATAGIPLGAGARAYADGCRFGHTFRGSFGFRILSPLDSNALTPELRTTSRRVVERLEYGITAVERASSTNDYDLLVRESPGGLNAKAYDDLASLLEQAETDSVRFKFILSPSVPRLQPESQTIELRTSIAPLVKRAAETLRSSYPAGEMSISGRIIRLFSRALPADLFHSDREIAVLWESPQVGNITVRIRISPEDYLKAIAAHEEGREVFVTGFIRVVGSRSARMENVTGFVVGDLVPD